MALGSTLEHGVGSGLHIAEAGPITLKLSEIAVDPELLLRPLDEETAQSYAEALKARRELPPVLVYLIDGQHTLCDGQHRLRAHQIAKRDRIACEIREGTRSDCLLASAGANSDHGKPRTTEHKRAAVLALRAQPEWADASARWLAEKCNVSPNFVIGILKTVHGEQLAPSVGKDGKTRKAPSKAKRKAFDASKQVRVLSKEIERLAKRWPSEVPVALLVEALLTHASALEKRQPLPIEPG